MIGRTRSLGLGGLVLLATPIGATPAEFAGTASVDLGYASNPFLTTDGAGNSGSAFSVGATVAPSLTWRAARSSTVLAGAYSRSEYLRSGYDASDTFGVSLVRDQTFSERLSGNARISYDNSRNSFAQPDEILDTTTLGSRREAISGDGSLTYRAGSRDILTLTASASKATYNNDFLGDYQSYSGALSYRRVLNSQTSVGVSMGVSRTNADVNGDTTTLSPRVLLDHTFNDRWTFNGSVGLLRQRTRFDQPPFGRVTSKSNGIGFDADLCRKAPRTNLCLTASRDTTASGLGGARVSTSAAVTYTRQLSERGSISASVSAADSKAADRSFLIPKERYYSADVTYRRTISRRFDAGLTGAYRKRDLSLFGDVDGFTVTLNLIAKFGRVR